MLHVMICIAAVLTQIRRFDDCNKYYKQRYHDRIYTKVLFFAEDSFFNDYMRHVAINCAPRCVRNLCGARMRNTAAICARALELLVLVLRRRSRGRRLNDCAGEGA